MKQPIIAALLLILTSLALSMISYQLNVTSVKDQQIEILKQMLHESNDREREYIKAFGVTLEDMEKENE